MQKELSMKPSSPETKHQKFVRLAEARTNKIIVTLRLLGNCSSPAAYEYSKSDVSKIFRAIEEATADAKRRFMKQDGVNNSPFKLD